MAGYVYTNENCIGCNRCISVCPILTANQAVVVDGKPRIEVNHAQCINCGACFDACEHQAREYADDAEQFLRICREANPFHCFWRRHFWRIIPESMSRF